MERIGGTEPSRRAAEDAARAAVRALDRRSRPTTTDAHFGPFLIRYLDAQAGRLAPSTLRTHRHYAAGLIIPIIGDMLLSELVPSDIDRVMAHLRDTGRSTATMRQVRAIISAALASAVRDRLVTSNAARDAQSPAGGAAKRVTRIPTDVELRRVLEEADRFGCGLEVRLACVLGVRRGELAALQWADVDLGTMVVTVCRSAEARFDAEKSTKSGRAREVRFRESTRDMLAAHRAKQLELATFGGFLPDTVVWVVGDGVTRARPDTLTRRWERVRAAAGVGDDIRLHDLRHRAATLLVAAGVDVAAAAATLGHSPEVMLRVYARAGDSGMNAAAEALSL